MRLFGAILAAAAFLTAPPAAASVLARCGVSEGVSYFLPGPGIPDSEAGWRPDRVSGGGLLLISDQGGVDIVISDAAGTRSAKADGATVIGMPSGEGKVLVLVVYPLASVAETYVFSLDRSGAGVVVWTSARAGAPSQRVIAMSAQCAAP